MGNLFLFLILRHQINFFYDLFLTETFSLINQYIDKDFDYAKEYYLNKGFSDKKASCLVVRDIVISQTVFDNKLNNSLNKDTFSPVPIIWLTRLITREFVSGNIKKMEINYDNLKKNCDEEFRELILPPGYLKNEFNYPISK